MGEHLKPCPFCGSRAESWQEASDDGRHAAFTGCMDDDCRCRTGPWPTRIDSEIAWNQRQKEEYSLAATHGPTPASALARAFLMMLEKIEDYQEKEPQNPAISLTAPCAV